MSENPYEASKVEGTAATVARRSLLALVAVAVSFVAGFASGGFVGYCVGIADGAEHAIHKENDATNDRWGNAP